MQNNINNNERDAFSDMVRQKLEGHQIPVDAGIWDNIEQRLASKKKRVIPFWLWMSGGAAVAVLALLFTLRPLTESKDSIGMTTHSKIKQVEGSHSTTAKDYQPKEGQFNKKASNPVQHKVRTSHQVKTALASVYPPAQIIIRDTTERKKINDTAPGYNLKEENNVALNSTENKDTVSGKTRYIPNSLVEEPVNKPLEKAKNKNGWLLAASVGSNGSVPTGNGNSEFFTLNDRNLVQAATSYTSIMKAADFSNINYLPPLSFGLVVRKELNKVLGLESGLVYTYLLTTFENNGMQRNDARLHLHYIGVPLNLVARLWNNPKWEIYLSGGGMIEKGIQSVYVQNQYTGSQTITTTAVTNIDGVQWSVNGSVGTTYKIQRNVGIFFEPRISYYFKNDQPLSARTEYPTVIGLTAGVRLQLK